MGILREAYNTFFGKEDDAVWRKFAEKNGGKYAPKSDHRVLFSHKNVPIAVGAYTHYTVVGGSSNPAHYTRMFVEFSSNDDFTFCLTRQGFFEQVGKLFGAQDIHVGNTNFDDKFMIKSNDEMKAILILSNELISAPLYELRTIRFEITREDGLWGERPDAGKYMLYFVSEGKMREIEELNKLYQLVVETIDQLSKTNTIKLQ